MVDLKRELYAQGQPNNYVADLTARAAKRIEQLEGVLRDVRHEICLGPVNDVLWHMNFPAETTVDYICNTLDDDWAYDDWLKDHGHASENQKSQVNTREDS